MRIELKILDEELYRVDKMGGSYYDTPSYQTPGSAAMDLISAEDVTLYPGECKLIKTGLSIWIGSNNGYKAILDDVDCSSNFMSIAAVILPRSGRGHKEGLILGNTAGLIDEDYQGELMVSAWNRKESDVETIYSDADFNMDIGLWEGTSEIEHNTIEIKRGERFAQMVLMPVIKAQWKVVEEFSSNTRRGEGGFGSTNN